MKKNTKKSSVEVKFKTSNHEYFAIIIPHKSIEELQMCERLTGFYRTQDGEEISILNQCDCIEGELDAIIEKLTLALSNQLTIDKTLLPNIGYQRNQWLHALKKGQPEWCGSIYLCFSTTHKIETFLYVEEGSIYLEIIPLYPWFFGNKPKGLKKISFKEFLKNYKPYVRVIITRETAKQWLATAQLLRNIIDQNYQSAIANLPTNET